MPEKELIDLLREVETYYSSRLAVHGATPQGVDWNGVESQTQRFRQLCSLVDHSLPYTLNDLGCGYGALFDYLANLGKDFEYRGCDVSKEMIDAARTRLSADPRVQLSVASEPSTIADYGIASGIFNVRQERSDAEWMEYILTTLDLLDRTSRRGFSFNCLTSYSHREKMRPYLFYTDPSVIFDHCMRKYSRHVALLHDYELYEFTILVRKIL